MYSTLHSMVRFHHKFSWPLARPISEADLKILYFRTKMVSDNEPSDQTVPFILLSNHALRCIHEISNLVVHFLRWSAKNHISWLHRAPGRFCILTPKPSLKTILTFMIVHLKWLSMHGRNSTFRGVFSSFNWNPVFVHTPAKIRRLL